MSITKNALIIVDMQNDFCEGGSLQVKGGAKLASEITDFLENTTFDLVVTTQDWHPAKHESFCSNNQNEGQVKLFEEISLIESGQKQIMWPDHCIQNTKGSEFHPNLKIDFSQTESIKKGTNINWESYSGFGCQGEDTGLEYLLKNHDITQVFVVGLAYDYCVCSTSIDSTKKGWKTYIIKNLTRAISDDKSQIITEEFISHGGNIIDSFQISDYQ